MFRPTLKIFWFVYRPTHHFTSDPIILLVILYEQKIIVCSIYKQFSFKIVSFTWTGSKKKNFLPTDPVNSRSVNSKQAYLSRRMRNQQNDIDICAQRRLRSAWASAESDQSLRCALKGRLRTQGFFMQTEKTLIRLGGHPGWSESSLGAQVILLVLLCCGSFFKVGLVVIFRP